MRPSIFQLALALFLGFLAVSIGMRPVNQDEKISFTAPASSSAMSQAMASSVPSFVTPPSKGVVECPESVYQQLSASDRYFDDAHNVRFDMGINPAWGTDYDTVESGIVFGFPMQTKQGNSCVTVRSYAFTVRPYRSIDAIRLFYGKEASIYTMGGFTVAEWSDVGCGAPRIEVVGIDYNYQFSVPCGYPRTQSQAVKDLQRFVATLRYIR